MNKVKIDPRLKEFGKNLKRVRKDRGLSLRAVAQNCDIDHSDIWKYERGETNPTYLSILELAKGLEVEPAEIVTIIPSKSK